MKNAFEPPVVVGEMNERDAGSLAIGCLVLPCLGAVVGFLSFFGSAYILEKLFPLADGAPFLSHGQQAMLFTVPICTMTGLGIGIGLAFALARQVAVAISVLVLTSIGTLTINTRLWNAQISRYGRDYSEMVLYYPPVILVVVAALLAALLTGLAFRRFLCEVRKAA